MGECPTYHLEIDKSKKVKLYSEQVYIEHDKFMYETDHSKVGYFTGAISDSIYSMLVKELKKCGIDTLTFKDVTCCDGSIKTIIVYYNGRRKYLKSMDTPEIARPLISLLRNICQSKYLHRTQEKFKIEE